MGKTTENFSGLISAMEAKIEELKKEFDEKIANGIPVKEVEKEKNEDDENLEEDKSEEKKGSLINEEDLKMIKENHKKIAEIDKALKLFISGSHLDTMKTDIAKLQEDILLRAFTSEIDELKDQICKKNFLLFLLFKLNSTLRLFS